MRMKINVDALKHLLQRLPELQGRELHQISMKDVAQTVSDRVVKHAGVAAACTAGNDDYPIERVTDGFSLLDDLLKVIPEGDFPAVESKRGFYPTFNWRKLFAPVFQRAKDHLEIGVVKSKDGINFERLNRAIETLNGVVDCFSDEALVPA